MKKVTKNSLDELAEVMPVISECDQMFYIGGSGHYANGDYSSPYSIETADRMMFNGVWTGGYVKFEDGSVVYCNPDNEVLGRIKSGMFNSYYIGPTEDWVIGLRPEPRHAADYIAQQHDLDYCERGLSGVTGVFSTSSAEVDERLIIRCDAMLRAYENGATTYGGYPITRDAVDAAKAMIWAFTKTSGMDFINR